MTILFRPQSGVAADFIPFVRSIDPGGYELFYLRDWRDIPEHGEGTPWHRVSTRDFVDFTDHGEALPRGAADSQDLYVFTGCVVEHADVFHIFYTGHNPHLAKAGKPVQTILHATSPDLATWTKDAAFAIHAPIADGYAHDDWRDPFVFALGSGGWGMLLAARRSEGPARHRGLTAWLTSPDLVAWTVREPFWAPDQFFTHECPDLFRIGDWWYLVFSEFSERNQTRYRMARDPRGPWIAPADDALDSRAWYAAKSAGDGLRRFMFGWLATRAGDRDDGGYQWGGDLVVHEIVQRPDGMLASRLPTSVAAAFAVPLPCALTPVLGAWTRRGDSHVVDALGRFASCLAPAAMPGTCLIEVDVTCDEHVSGAGVLLRASADGDHAYQVRIEPSRQRLVVDRWPRPSDQPFMHERPLAMAPGRPVHLRILVDGSCVVVYADDETALSARLCERRGDGLGLFAADGGATFAGLRVLGRR